MGSSITCRFIFNFSSWSSCWNQQSISFCIWSGNCSSQSVPANHVLCNSLLLLTVKGLQNPRGSYTVDRTAKNFLLVFGLSLSTLTAGTVNTSSLGSQGYPRTLAQGNSPVPSYSFSLCSIGTAIITSCLLLNTFWISIPAFS